MVQKRWLSPILPVEVRPTVTIQNVDTLTNETGVLVEPASVNVRKNPTTNEYVDPDITNKSITITIPGKAFTGVEERWIEIKQGATIKKAKYKIDGVSVHEQPWNRKTILTVTDDFSAYTKDVDATVYVYLTATATKAVATATVKVIDMPFNLVFFKTDHLGTPRVITDQDGTVLSTHDYLAYGEELTDPEFQTNNMKFTGHERDAETGLDYMLARYYTAGSGRMLQVDPGHDYDMMDPMSFNLYGYVRGNPVMGTDPTGMAEQKSRARERFEADSGLWNIHHWGEGNDGASNDATSNAQNYSSPSMFSGVGLSDKEKNKVQFTINITLDSTASNNSSGGPQILDDADLPDPGYWSKVQFNFTSTNRVLFKPLKMMGITLKGYSAISQVVGTFGGSTAVANAFELPTIWNVIRGNAVAAGVEWTTTEGLILSGLSGALYKVIYGVTLEAGIGIGSLVQPGVVPVLSSHSDMMEKMNPSMRRYLHGGW